MTEDRSASDRLKVRLIGAVALLLIGVVGWFWLLDADNPIEPVAQESAIPPAPAIQPFTVPQPAAPADIPPVGSERDAAVVEEASVQQQVTKPVPAPMPVTKSPAPELSPKVQPKAQPTTQSMSQTVPESPKPKLKPEPKASTSNKTEAAFAAKPSVVKVPADKFEMDSNGLPVAWVVQVGAMATQASADKLKEQLIAKGFKAFTQPTKLPNGTAAIKVYVGPKLSRERADAQKKSVDTALKTNTMVVRFPPT